MVRNQQQTAALVRQSPNVTTFMSSIGGGSSSVSLGGPNFGRIFMHLKPRSQRAQGVDEVMAEMRIKLAAVPGMRAFMQNPPSIRIGGTLTKSLYQFTLQGTNNEELFRVSQNFEKELAAVPGLQDVTSDLQIKNPQMNVVIDRDKAAALNVTADQIENALYDAYGPRWVSTIYAPTNQYKVLMEMEPEYQEDPGALSMLYLKSSTGALVPLDTVARLTSDLGPQTINHYGQLPAVTISFNLKPGVALGDAVTDIHEIAQKSLPATVTTTFQGAAKAFQDSLNNLW